MTSEPRRYCLRVGERIELVRTDDPYTSLRPGTRGNIVALTSEELVVDWDDGSSLSMLPGDGDLVRPMTDAEVLNECEAPGGPHYRALAEAVRRGLADDPARRCRARSEIRHPEIRVHLVGEDGNAFGVLGAVRQALRDAGVSADEQQEFYDEATSGNYDHLLATVAAWVVIE